MAEITAALVKELREKTGVGMMDCKKALAETHGDIEAAIDWLRAKGLSKAAKKADRAAAEGVVALALGGKDAAMIEFNAETDFVARNAQFQTAAAAFAKIALEKKGDLQAVLAAPAPDGEAGTVSDQITRLIATIGENMTLRRAAYVSVGDGVIAHYVHTPVAENMGRIGVLVAVQSTGKAEALAEIGRKVAMHIAATNPLALTEADIDPAVVAHERGILLEQIKEDPKAAGKPQQVLDKMLEGRMRKFFEESVLLKQAFVINPDLTVEAAVKEAEKAAGAPVAIAKFVRFGLGEGVDKKTDDFAAEVAAMTKG
ncbi:MAG: elongation factor Ts [Alphaproteobacteria bacterium]|nr:elongation factor Ts [Alphaproteobacteria bacterium]